MGGDSYCSSIPSTEDVPLSTEDFPHEISVSSEDEECLSHKLENDPLMKGARVSDSGEFPDVNRRKTSIAEAAEKQKSKVYTEVLRSYEVLQPRIDQLEEAKNKILSYTPGSWSKVASMDLGEYDVPKATSILLIGPKGSGRSSLVNKISRVFESNLFLSPRAQVSCSSAPGDGTYFLHEYMIPRGSGSFCLYDTRGLSVDSSENLEMIKRWMTKGVRHGELIRRCSDSIPFEAELRCKARRNFSSGRVMARSVDFVIFVVNGLSVLESMDSTDETKKGYSQMIATTFNNSLLSFKDDKPAIVVTHGDLLPLSDRVRVRAHLGELLGVPPIGQIFDIPGTRCSYAFKHRTKIGDKNIVDDQESCLLFLAIEMLIYCLDRADLNLPPKVLFSEEVLAVAKSLFRIVMVAIVFFFIFGGLMDFMGIK